MKKRCEIPFFTIFIGLLFIVGIFMFEGDPNKVEESVVSDDVPQVQGIYVDDSQTLHHINAYVAIDADAVGTAVPNLTVYKSVEGGNFSLVENTAYDIVEKKEHALLGSANGYHSDFITDFYPSGLVNIVDFRLHKVKPLEMVDIFEGEHMPFNGSHYSVIIQLSPKITDLYCILEVDGGKVNISSLKLKTAPEFNGLVTPITSAKPLKYNISQ